MGFITRGIKNAFRNIIRTFSITLILAISIGLSLIMLLSLKAVQARIESVKSSIGNVVTVSPAGARGFEGGGSALTQDQISKIEKLANVNSVDKSLSDRLTSSDTNLKSAVDAGALGQRFSNRSGQTFTPPPTRSGETGTVSFTPPVTVLGTSNPTDLSSTQGGGKFKLTTGEIYKTDSAENVALVGASLATKNSLSVGSTFTAYNTSVKVVGIFDAGNTFSNNQAIMPLLTLQKLSAQTGAITSATVKVNSITNIDSVTEAVKKTLGAAADVTNSSEQAKQTLGPLESIKNVALYSLIGALGAGSIIIFLTMLMIVRERRREIGVLKAIGAANSKIMLQFITESLTLTFLGGVIGFIGGLLLSNPVLSVLVSSSSTTSTSGGGQGSSNFAQFAGGGLNQARNAISNIHTVVGYDLIIYGILAILIIAIVGSAIPAFFISKIRPAEVLRSE